MQLALHWGMPTARPVPLRRSPLRLAGVLMVLVVVALALDLALWIALPLGLVLATGLIAMKLRGLKA